MHQYIKFVLLKTIVFLFSLRLAATLRAAEDIYAAIAAFD